MGHGTLHFAYCNDHKLTTYAGEATLRHVDIGNIRLPTGHIFAVDPLVFADRDESFEIAVTPGSYPVRLSIAHFDNGDQRVAFAVILFSTTPPIHWQMALLPGQIESTLRKDEAFGYPVDSGTGSFMDRAAGALLQRRFAGDEAGCPKILDVIEKEMEKTYVQTWSHMNLDLSDDCNLVAFSSGFGDGVYASYFGFAEGSEPVCLLTGFGIADPPDPKDAELKGTRAAKWWQFWKRNPAG